MNISTICIFAALATLSCAGGLCLVLSLAVFAASAALYAAARRNMRKERPDGPRQEQPRRRPAVY